MYDGVLILEASALDGETRAAIETVIANDPPPDLLDLSDLLYREHWPAIVGRRRGSFVGVESRIPPVNPLPCE
jgi:hypothetical protein